MRPCGWSFATHQTSPPLRALLATARRRRLQRLHQERRSQPVEPAGRSEAKPVLELSNDATASEEPIIEVFSKEVTGVTASSGSFRVGDAISGEHIPSGTTVTGVGPGTLTLSKFVSGCGGVLLTAEETTTPFAPWRARLGGSAQEATIASPAMALVQVLTTPRQSRGRAVHLLTTPRHSRGRAVTSTRHPRISTSL